MKYMMLIYEDKANVPAPGSEEFMAIIGKYGEFAQGASSDGVMVGGDPLEDTSTATTVRVRDGKVETLDGPFAETKEQLAGYFILDCEDLDQALAYAAKIPSAEFGMIEVRPIRVMMRQD